MSILRRVATAITATVIAAMPIGVASVSAISAFTSNTKPVSADEYTHTQTIYLKNNSPYEITASIRYRDTNSSWSTSYIDIPAYGSVYAADSTHQFIYVGAKSKESNTYWGVKKVDTGRGYVDFTWNFFYP